MLIANAALPASGLLSSFSVEELDRALAVNLRAPMVLAQALSAGMAARGAGHIVFISSMSGKTASVGASVYSATKFGLRGFALGLREDLRGSGVGVSTVFPGFISDAGMFHEAGVELPGYVATRTPEQVAAAVLRAIERDRSEIDVAPLVLRLGAAVGGVLPELTGRAAAPPGLRRDRRGDGRGAARQAQLVRDARVAGRRRQPRRRHGIAGRAVRASTVRLTGAARRCRGARGERRAAPRCRPRG